ncbi:trypsin-like serine protease [Listeria monocytogenes]|uniref:trypsin-like serine peptidase n=1 Tax=Listeria monocytogenes TaxID=1639 RepID=UPI0011EB1E9A|nr:trypsin-like peptidase domain-containing protein [Listeria monocytogenes]TYV67281.1 trypsin-like serine protease [Listeria monocytogenes]
MYKKIKFTSRLLIIVFSSLFFILPLRGYAETEVLSPPLIDINSTGELSASGISVYDLETNVESKQELPIIPRELSIENTESFVPNNVFSEQTVRQIVGKDTRTRVTNTTAFPNSTIGQMSITFPNGKTYVGTAWMYGNKVAVTAGHCVYSKSDGGWARTVAFSPGKNGSSNPLGTYYATQLYTDTKYVQNENSNYDWGMLRFGTNVGNKTGYLGAEWTSSSQVGINVTVRGYPGEKKDQLWTSNGNITGSGSSKTNYSIDTTGGQSGAPVYRYTSGNYRSLAIHTNSYSSYNQGERIDKSLFEIITNARKW